ncbi:MAG: PqqD family peptide modification chaperone [Actinomycetes bacterium]
MSSIALLVGVTLTTVFVVSGVAKLADRSGTHEAVLGFGVPARVASLIAALLPPLELLAAIALVVPLTRTLGLVLALLLLGGFTVAVVLALRAGRRPDCRCFGRIGGADISSRTVVRNIALAGLAVVGLATAGGADRVTGSGSTLAILMGIGLAGLVVLSEGLAGRVARQRREAKDEATYDTVERIEAPDFRLATLDGGVTTLTELLAPGLPVMLVTLSPGCGPCKALRPDVAQWAGVLGSSVAVAVLATGTRESNLASYDGMSHLPVLLDEAGVRQQLGTAAAPSAVVIGRDGFVSSGVATGERLVRRLLASTIAGTELGTDPVDSGTDDGIPANEIDLSSTVSPRPGVSVHTTGESTVLLDTATGATVVVDQIGALVWSVLDGTARLEEIVVDLADVFGAPVETIGADVLELARSLGRSGLLDGVSPEVAGGHVHEPAPAH